MSKASKRRRAMQQRPVAPPPPQGPSSQVLMGLGLALVVVVIVVLIAGGGGLGQIGGGKTTPSTAAAMIEQGNQAFDAANYADAISWYGRALALEPSNADVRTDMATAYFYAGDVARAITEGRAVLAQDPNKVQTLLNMGIWLANQNPPDTASAVTSWRKVIALYPNTADAKQAQDLIDRYNK
jgi:Tfp pilus assembly protein PilF